MGRNPDYRTSEQYSSKWNIVNKLVTHWNKIYTKFEKQRAKGESETVVKRSIRWTKLTTHEDIANPPKRSRTSSYSSSQQVTSDGHIGVNLNDDNNDIEEIHPPPPPMGIDKTKARVRGKGKATSSNLSFGTERSTRSNEMITQITQLNTTLEKHMTETVRLTKYPLLIQDVRHLDPEDEVAKVMKVSIREKYNLKRK
ncbi:unnamed protein product [Lactuca saligna]|uniref:No apical meristem-associated C-terminal domain-containing protein n=1 Tax=Lactuca saligna TaxID=75948 RepID=A0AA35UWD0_LACSI|nr:unnamed protein product [Lactuca saligna]CAI9266231.1 unnamed protein product [Lactuca saligna]CAI9303453.1 unnamed protein product [Lactuca saligna]